MDQKRAMTSVDIRALATELRSYEGAKVDKAYLYDDDMLRLKLRDFDRGRVELLLEVGDPKRAHVADVDHVPEAPGRPPNFAMMLRNRLSGADLVRTEQFEFDRIVEFEFDRDDANTILVVELFGDGNVAVCNSDYEVVDSLETVRLKSRTVAPGSMYEFPSSRFNPLTADYEGFEAKMEQSDTDVVRTLATQLNFGGLWAEELCTRAGVEKTIDIADATADDYEKLFGAIERLRDRLLDGRFDARVYYESDEGGEEAGASDAEDSDSGEHGPPVDVTPVPLEEHEAEGLEVEAFDTVNDALDAYFFELDRETETPADAGRDRPDFEAQIEKQERIVQQQEGAIEEFEEEAETEREKAELLYGNYDLVDEVLSTVREALAAGHSWDDVEERFEEAAAAGNDRAERVVGSNPQNGTVAVEIDGHRIDLDPDDGVEKNADRLYTEAKRIRGKKEGAQAAIEDTREELEAIERRREEWDGKEAPEEDEEDEGEPEDVDWLSRQSIPVRSDEQWYERFRWFRTSDGFLVIGGRNADQNEELVKKYMERGDLFFHTQAHGGPVTVLKASDPSESGADVDIPEPSREEAARFAVSYSSIWKEGKFAGDAYAVTPDQVSKTPESGEYLEKGGFAVRGDRTYYRDIPVDVTVGITCEPETRVVGGPKRAIEPRAATTIDLEPGRYAQNDIAMMCYREFKERFTDETFVRKVASADRIQEFCPPGGSRIED